MFLHVGDDEIVYLKDVLAIMDIEKTTTSTTTRDYLKICQERGIIKNVGSDIPKSFVVTCRNGKHTVYLSPISAATLLKRAKKTALKNGRNQL